MYLRYTTKRKSGKVHRYWTPVRSVRIGRRVVQQTVAQLGELDTKGPLQAQALARHLIGTPEQTSLFDDGTRDVAVPVRLKGIKIERARQFGDVYLALALWRGAGLADLCTQIAAIRQRTSSLGEDRRGAGCGTTLRTVERTTHCRRLVSAHGAW